MLKGETPAKRELAESTIDSPHQHYLTKRGANLFIPNGAEIGDVVYSPRSVDGGNETDSHLDEIVARANATIAEI